eukprot:g32707.t1
MLGRSFFGYASPPVGPVTNVRPCCTVPNAGNYNGDHSDDKRMPNGDKADSPEEFGTSWLVPGTDTQWWTGFGETGGELLITEFRASDLLQCTIPNRSHHPEEKTDRLRRLTTVLSGNQRMSIVYRT